MMIPTSYQALIGIRSLVYVRLVHAGFVVFVLNEEIQDYIQIDLHEQMIRTMKSCHSLPSITL